ncbi:MIP/aquaporin family protein [Kineococcus rhizosphaerae]|uniref:Aquaporin NIP n=1 Tax=Kineococcus rhizosphaerae TaxID=559628 RepID=A0A2T0R3H9_9ACTN|nr:MIP family channel protein [Kineococcus rhizosphaerae]PRY14571.1 aquaporin NIP [Kineococcus rhizosphaerae]
MNTRASSDPVEVRRSGPSRPRSTAGGSGLFGSSPGTRLLRSATAEVVGTFVLVLAGTATAIGAGQAQPVYQLVAVVLAFGIALAAMAATLGHVSGCHLNPAVTLALATTRRFPWRAVPAYVVAQLLGGVLGSLAAWGAYSGSGRDVVALSATVPADGVGTGRAFFVEAVVTFVLVLVVISVATDERVPGGLAPLAVGAALATAIFIAGPVTGGAVNPARAFGPAVVSGTTTSLWLYLVAPVVGGLVAAVLYDRLLRPAAPPAEAD